MNPSEKNVKKVSSLIHQLRIALPSPRFLLSTFLSGNKNHINLYSQNSSLLKNFDLISVRGFAFHKIFDSETIHHAPLYARPGEINIESEFIDVVSCFIPFLVCN